jgi:hypothetical protein
MNPSNSTPKIPARPSAISEVVLVAGLTDPKI